MRPLLLPDALAQLRRDHDRRAALPVVRDLVGRGLLDPTPRTIADRPGTAR